MANYLRSFAKNIPYLWMRNKVQMSVPISCLNIGEAVPFFGRWNKALYKGPKRINM
jgi:hypothetical protein